MASNISTLTIGPKPVLTPKGGGIGGMTFTNAGELADPNGRPEYISNPNLLLSGNTGIVGPQQTVIPNKPKGTPKVNPIWFVIGAALLLFLFRKK